MTTAALAFPLHEGVCDLCSEDTRVRLYADEFDVVACCDGCERALLEGWEAMLDERYGPCWRCEGMGT